MMKKYGFFVLIFVLLSNSVFAQNFNGHYTATIPEGTVQMTLQQNAAGTVVGKMIDTDGSTYQVEGTTQQGVVSGVAYNDVLGFFFEARFKGQELSFLAIPANLFNQPIYDAAQEFLFTKKVEAPKMTPVSPPQKTSGQTEVSDEVESQPPLQKPPVQAQQPVTPGQKEDSLKGIFSNERFTLELSEEGNQYSGQLALGENRYPVSLQTSGGGKFAGTYYVNGNPQQFTAELDGTALLLTVGLETYRLEREVSKVDEWTGSFSNDRLILTLYADNEQYVGQITLGGTNYPVSARLKDNNTLEGIYSNNGIEQPFTTTLQGTTITLVVGLESYQLEKEAVIPTPQTSVTAQPSGAQETTSPQTLQAGQEVRAASLGFRFTPPAEWIANDTGQGYVLGSHTKKGIILIAPHEYRTLDDLRTVAKEGIIEEGVKLFASEPVESYGKNGIKAEFEGTLQQEQAKAYAVGLLSPYGGGITIMAAVEPASFSDEYRRFVEFIAESVIFTKPETSPLAEQWKQMLNGARLTYMSSYSSSSGDGSFVGSSEQRTLDLCPDDSYRYADSSSMSVDVGGGGAYSGGGDSGTGTWQIMSKDGQPILKLVSNDGSVFEATLEMQDGKTFVNGDRYFRTYADDPVAEHRPNCWQ